MKWYRHGVKNHHEAPAWHRTEDRRRRFVKNFGGCGAHTETLIANGNRYSLERFFSFSPRGVGFFLDGHSSLNEV
jgi:hypothetical protein